MYLRRQIDKLTGIADQQRRTSAPDLAPADPIPMRYGNPCWTTRARPTNPSSQSGNAGSPTSSAICCASSARCSRIVEMQKADAIRYFGADAIWKNVGQRLPDQTCTNRTGSHEDDGCWPNWRT